MGEEDSDVRGGQAGCYSQRRADCDAGDRARCAGAVWRGGGFDELDKDDLQGFAEFSCRSDWAQCVIRCARVRHVRDGERYGRTWWVDSVRLDILYVLGLLSLGASNGGDNERSLAVRFFS